MRRIKLRSPGLLIIMMSLYPAFLAALDPFSIIGSNSHSSNIAHPWPMIHKAIDTLQPGQTVIRSAGACLERVNPTKFRTPGIYFTFRNSDPLRYYQVATDRASHARSNALPFTTLPATTAQSKISLNTNEAWPCRHSTIQKHSFGTITNTLAYTGGTSHFRAWTTLLNSWDNKGYIKCRPQSNNANIDDFPISFSPCTSKAIGTLRRNAKSTGPDILTSNGNAFADTIRYSSTPVIAPELNAAPPRGSSGRASAPLAQSQASSTLSLMPKYREKCKYPTMGRTDYDSKQGAFAQSAGSFRTTIPAGPQNRRTNAFYVVRKDGANKQNTDAYVINSSVQNLQSQPQSPRWFEISHDIITPSPGTDNQIAVFYANRLMSMTGLWGGLLRPDSVSWFQNTGHGLHYNLAGSDLVLQRKYAAGETFWNCQDTACINQQVSGIRYLTSYFENTLHKPNKIWWLPMFEWDQWYDGYWASPKPNSGTSRAVAYANFKNHFLGLNPLGIYLRQTRQQRGFSISAVTDFASNTFYAYDMGVDLGLLERMNDELGDFSTGTAFQRGAARQFNKPWGYDISLWRTAGDTPIEYQYLNGRMVQTGGYSLSYIKRGLFVGYMSGANLLSYEPSILLTEGQLNPFATLLRNFADFSLERHTDVGLPAVDTAIMLDFYEGFDPRHGKYMQTQTIWYGRIPYSDGDHMTDKLLQLIYPGFDQSGTPGVGKQYPWVYGDAASYRTFLANGGDTRPYEPMPKSRWGDNFDVITNTAPQSALDNYKIIILAGNTMMNSELRTKLETWVRNGGTLIVNAKQVTNADYSSLTGVQVSLSQGSSNYTKWLPDNTVYNEPSYNYYVVNPTSANIIADDNNGHAIITRNSLGQGQVYLATPYYMMDAGKSQILRIGQRLLGNEIMKHAPATIEGNMLEYIVNRADLKVVVTLVNSEGSTWNGFIVIPRPVTSYSAAEWIADAPAKTTEVGSNVKISASVPPYDVKVYAFTWRGRSGRVRF